MSTYVTVNHQAVERLYTRPTTRMEAVRLQELVEQTIEPMPVTVRQPDSYEVDALWQE